MLLVYQREHDAWTPKLRWQTPALKRISGPGVVQVEMGWARPGSDSAPPMPGSYFLIREVEQGYLMLIASSVPDRSCIGPHLVLTGLR